MHQTCKKIEQKTDDLLHNVNVQVFIIELLKDKFEKKMMNLSEKILTCLLCTT